MRNNSSGAQPASGPEPSGKRVEGRMLCLELLLRRLQEESIADKEPSVLRAREQLVPVMHCTTYDAVRKISPSLPRETA